MKLEDCFKQKLLVKKKPSPDKMRQSLQSAQIYIRKANDNLEIKNYDIAIVVAYTSMFHSLRSILFRDGIKERSHLCLLIYVKNTYPELSELANNVDIYRRFRHTALYGLETTTSREEAKTSIEVAQKVYMAIKKFLKL